MLTIAFEGPTDVGDVTGNQWSFWIIVSIVAVLAVIALVRIVRERS